MIETRDSSAWIEITCRQCGSKQRVRRCYVERGRMKYCSRRCAASARRTRGAEPVEDQGDIFTLDGNGYFLSRRTGRMLHRVIWEDNYGPIPEGHRVYHRDRNRSNYRLENLYLKKMKERSCCDEMGCQEKAYARGKCRKHYRRLWQTERRGSQSASTFKT